MHLRIRSGRVAAVLLALIMSSCSDDTKTVKADVYVPPDGGGFDRLRESSVDAGPAQEFIILHTNDLHSSIEGFSPVSEYTPATTDDDATRGGFARLAAVIKSERAAAGSTPVLLLDAGDFMQGSLFGWLANTKAVELTLMQQLGYDATTLGNHEFDWTPAGLALTIEAAVKGGFKVPIMAPANIKFDATSTADDTLENLQKNGTLQKKLIKTLPNGLKVGIFGMMGKEAGQNADEYGALPITFTNAADAARAMVKELRDIDKVNLVIMLSHSGSHADGTGEDVDLAKDVPGIDVIVSGHTHDPIMTPLQAGKTIVAQAGYHSRYLGKLRIKVQGGAVSLVKGELLAIDDKTKGDTATQTAVTGYITDIDALLKAGSSPLTYRKTVVETSFDLTYPQFQEAILGNIIVDGYLSAAKKAQPTEPAQVAFESNGVVGNPALKGTKGQLWFADIFHSVQAGVGPDKLPGYPLVAFYLSGADLKAGMEILALSKTVLNSNAYFFQVAGMKVEYLNTAPLLNAVTSIKIGEPPVTVNLTDKTTCYKVTTSLVVGRLLGEVKQLSKGLLTIDAKEKDCKTVIADVTTHIIDRDPVTAGLQELKAWQAVVDFMSAFPDLDGDKIPDVPDVYKNLQGRIIAK